MYERMLNKHEKPEIADMTAYCGENGELFALFNEWLSETHGTTQNVSFPYGNSYGWGIAHRIKQKLICNVFAEKNAFTVMVRLSGKQFESIYSQVRPYAKDYIDNKYPCGDGGWIHYRVTCRENMEDIKKILAAKRS